MNHLAWSDPERQSAAALAGALNEPAANAGLLVAATLLVTRHLRFDAADPHWPDRDRLVFGGDTAPLATAIGNLLATDESSHPAGQAHSVPDGRLALGIAVGLAHAERLLAARHGGSLVDHRVWLFATALDLAGGAAQEAASAAASLGLHRLTAIIACAHTNASRLSAFAAKGWSVREVDAGCPEAVGSAFSAASRSRRPNLIVCRGQEVAVGQMTAEAGEAAAPCWAEPGRRMAASRRGWLKRLNRHAGRQDFERAQSARLPLRWHELLAGPGTDAVMSTAGMLRQALSRVAAALPELVILTAEDSAPASPGCIAWTAQPHALGGALCGMALHEGLIPAGRCSLADSEALLPALRLAAYSGLRIVLAMTEPGAGDRARGRKAALRAMNNLFIFRPADAMETLECAELALRRRDGPSVLLLSDRAAPPPAGGTARPKCARGGYVLREANGPRDLTVLASGADVAIALSVQDLLAANGLAAAVVSLPCWDLFSQQDQGWREQALGAAPIVALEAGSGFGWERWTAHDGRAAPGLFIDTGEDGDPPRIEAAIRANLDKAAKPLENPRNDGHG